MMREIVKRIATEVAYTLWAIWMAARIIRKYGVRQGNEFVDRWLEREKRLYWRATGRHWDEDRLKGKA